MNVGRLGLGLEQQVEALVHVGLVLAFHRHNGPHDGRDGAGVAVSIADAGCGIPAEAGERVYAPFFTSRAGGLGLGLAICRSIVEMHGGRLWHEPRPGGGTIFHFSLPRSQA